jgi:serine/threonine protein kinase
VTFLSDATLAHLRDVAAWPEFTTDRYVVREMIGRGGMAAVYAAHDTALGRDVAIKVGARLAGEARMTARLEHPGIVPVHDFGALADGRPFYVMTRVEGQALAALLETSPPLAERLRIYERVCEAVSFAHSRGVIHRDLTPGNIMIGSFGEVVVTDFGVASLLAAGGEPGVVLGTRGFMPPEQAAGAADTLDERADVYALGAVLAAMLDAASPAPLRSIARRAMAHAREARYPTVAALADDVRRFRDGDAVHAHRESALERAARFGRNYRVPIVLVLAYIVMRALIAVFSGV